MTPPPRPAKVTAAGVLLVVVGADVLLVSLGAVGVLLWVAVGFAFVPCVAATVVVGWVPVSLGGMILSHGVAGLRGQMQATSNAAAGYIALGAIGVLVVGMIGVFGVCGLGRVSLRSLDPVVVGATLFAGSNAVAMLVAGVFLGQSAGRYEEWVRAKATPPPPGEPDDEL